MKRFFLLASLFFSFQVSFAQEAESHTNGIDNTFKRNLITWEFAELIMTNLSVSYERFSKSGKWGFRIPVSIGLEPTYGSVSFADGEVIKLGYKNIKTNEAIGTDARVFATGFNLNYYLVVKGKSKYFIGPEINVAINKAYLYYYEGDSIVKPYLDTVTGVWIHQYPYWNEHYEYGHSVRASFHLHNGWMFQAGRHISLVTALGLGYIYQYFETSQGTFYEKTPSLTLRFSVGYRFG